MSYIRDHINAVFPESDRAEVRVFMSRSRFDPETEEWEICRVVATFREFEVTEFVSPLALDRMTASTRRQFFTRLLNDLKEKADAKTTGSGSETELCDGSPSGNDSGAEEDVATESESDDA